MIPIEKVKSIINTYEKLEKELSSSSIDKKDFVKKSKEYSNIGEIINEAKGYISFEKEKRDLEKIINEKSTDKEMVQLAKSELSQLTKKNLDYNKKDIDFSNNYEEYQKYILADAQTSGGLLMSCPKENSEILVKLLNKNSKYKSKIIGEFTNKQNCNIICN